jgi:hypothetical protein
LTRVALHTGRRSMTSVIVAMTGDLLAKVPVWSYLSVDNVKSRNGANGSLSLDAC